MSVARRFPIAGATCLLAACTGTSAPPSTAPSSVNGYGQVTGRFLAVGGPFQAQPAPQPGHVYVRDGSRTVKAVTVGDDGRYRFALAPGSYSLGGRTPKFIVNGAMGRCAAVRRLVIRPDQTVHLNVYCQRK